MTTRLSYDRIVYSDDMYKTQQHRLIEMYKLRAQEYLVDDTVLVQPRCSSPSTLPPRSQPDRDDTVASYAVASIKKRYF
jgi:hypothetical protein